jgi:hypothetical protein
MPAETPIAASAAGNVPVYLVSELSGAYKRTIETAYGHVRMRGEGHDPAELRPVLDLEPGSSPAGLDDRQIPPYL